MEGQGGGVSLVQPSSLTIFALTLSGKPLDGYFLPHYPPGPRLLVVPTPYNTTHASHILWLQSSPCCSLAAAADSAAYSGSMSGSGTGETARAGIANGCFFFFGTLGRDLDNCWLRSSPEGF